MSEKDLFEGWLSGENVTLNCKCYELSINVVLIKVNLILKVWHQKGQKKNLSLFLLYTLDWIKLSKKMKQLQDY